MDIQANLNTDSTERHRRMAISPLTIDCACIRKLLTHYHNAISETLTHLQGGQLTSV